MSVIISRISALSTDDIYNLNQEIFKDEILYDKNFIKKFCDLQQGLIAKIDGTPQGYILFDRKKEDTLSFVIVSIGVKNEHRKKGIGSQLLKMTIKHLCEYNIYLHVRINNENALKLYKKMGFKITQVLPQYYNLIKYGREDAFEMKRVSLKQLLRQTIKKKERQRNGLL